MVSDTIIITLTKKKQAKGHCTCIKSAAVILTYLFSMIQCISRAIDSRRVWLRETVCRGGGAKVSYHCQLCGQQIELKPDYGET